MKYLFLILTIFLFANSSIAQEFKKISNSSAVKSKLEAHYKSTSSLTADFKEEVHSNMFKNPSKANGTMHFKKTDKIRWENETNKQLIVLNGAKVKLYENGKSVSNPMANKLVKKIQGMMLSMLSGEFLNEKDFTINYAESSSSYKLLLLPKSPRMAKYIQSIELIFDKKTLFLNEMTLFEKDNQKLIYTFANIKSNTAISDSKFN